MEDRGTTDRFAIRRGAPAISGLVVALYGHEVTFGTARGHKNCSCRTTTAAGSGLKALSSGQLAFSLQQI